MPTVVKDSRKRFSVLVRLLHRRQRAAAWRNPHGRPSRRRRL